jgi:Ran GTPase-activating protein (RanGAP) involved in mRNA processing and transport
MTENGPTTPEENIQQAKVIFGDQFHLIISCLFENEPNMTEISLNGFYFGDEVEIGTWILGNALKKNSSLDILSMYDNNLDDVSMMNLVDGFEKNLGLRRIELSYNRITPSGGWVFWHSLLHHPKVSHIDISSNAISNLGFEDLCEFLTVNNTLTYLNLDHNVIGDSGLPLLIQGLEHNGTLHTLSLSGNIITNEGAKLLDKCLHKNKSLKVLLLDNNRISSYLLKDLEAKHPDVKFSTQSNCIIN